MFRLLIILWDGGIEMVELKKCVSKYDWFFHGSQHDEAVSSLATTNKLQSLYEMRI